MMNNLQSSAQVANKLLTVLQRYTKGIRFVAFLLVLFTVNIGTASAEKSIDFESGTATYSDWTFTNMTSQQSGSITAKGGSYYGTTGGKSTASIQTKNQISSPKSISCYVSKQSNNTTSSTWYIQTSANGSSWTNVKTQSATSMSKGSWVEFTADLSSYSNVYVRIYYSGSTAVRNIDNLVLTEGTTTSYDVNWMVNGENYTTGSPSTSVSEGSQVTILPTPPTLDCGGKMFVGWSNEEVTDGTEPDVLFATAENSPAITEPTTFHAVFATKGSNQTATFDAATISGLTKSSSSLTWTHNNSGIALYLSEGQRYTSGTPNTFTVTKGTSNYCQLSAPTGIVMSKVVATLSGANYKINSVSTPWTLSTSSTIQTISSTNGSDYLKMSATSDYQIRITQLVVTYATYSDYTTQCSTQTVVTLYPNGGAISEDGWETTDGGDTYTKNVETTSDVTLPTPTKDGYEFGGWYENSGFTGSAVTAVPEGTEGEKTYYAKWNCIAPTSVTVTPTNEYGWRYSIGETISLEATATGGSADAYSYQWQKFIESAWEDIDGATSQVYTKECGTGDGGTYRCVVSTGDGCSTESNEYWVRVFTLAGNFKSNSEWNDEKITWSTEDNQHTIGTVTLTLPANATYEFKVTDNEGRWFGNPGIINATTDWWGFGVNDNNCTLQTKQAGEYIFTIDVAQAANAEGTYVNVKVTFPTTQIIYFKPATSGTWADNAKFTIYSWGSGDPSYTPLEDKDCGGIYSAEISTAHTSLLFIKASTYKENFDNITAQTINLTAPIGDKMLFDMSKLYLTPNSNWKEADARFAAYFFGNGNTWASMNKVEGETNLYEVAIPTNKDYPNVIFCRMNPSTTTNNWDNTWNQTNDLTLTTDGKRHNHYTVEDGAWSNGNGTWDGYWTTYTPNYTVSFDANGHGTAPEDQCITDGGIATPPTPAPTATGYTFAGWYKDADCTNAWDFAYDVVTSNITLYAKWTINTHTVTWKLNGGNIGGDESDIEQTYQYGATIEAPEKPTYVCHEFVEWTPTYNAEMTMPDEDLVFTATWNKLSYTITFKNYDGTVLQTSTVECGETPSYTGAAPTREQTAQYTYTFKGWSPTIAPATQDQVYTAQFNQTTRSYTVTWMVGTTEYTTGTPTNQVEYNKKVTNLPTSPLDDAIGTCANKFIGWSTKSSGSNAENADYYDDLFTTAENSPAITDATTFYAVFATAEETGGGTVEATLSFASTDQRTSVSTLQQVWTQNGITFTHDKANGDDIKDNYAPIRCYKNSKITIAHTSNTITKIVFDCNSNDYATALKNSIGSISGTVSSSSDKVTVAFTNAVTSFTVTLSSGQVRLDALTVTAGGGTITTYSNYVTNCCALAPATNLTVSGTTAYSATLTWTAPTSTTGITKLQVRDGSGNVVVDNLAANTTSATIYGLTECTSYQYYVVSVGDCEVFSNTVTATPFSGAKTVNYEYNGGNGSPASFTTNCTNQTITLPAATRTGYDFNGWYTAATGGTRVGGAGDTYNPATSPVTLYAQWTINQYTVTWNPNGGKWGESTSNIVETYEYGAAINTPADPTRENGIFKGWNPSVPSNMPAGNQIYTAQWEMVYTLTFVDMNAGGTTSTLTQTSSGQNIVAPTANSEVCNMWTFIGWAPSNSLNGGTDKPTGFIAAGETILGSQITENKTYYSVYSYNSDNTQEFEVGKSGTYLMYAISGTTKYYATTATSSGNAFYTNQENNFATYGYPSTFTLTYNSASKKYKIYHENTTEGKNSQGYLYQSDATDSEINVKSETSYTEFTISEGTAEGSFVISFPRTGKADAYFGGSSSSNFSGKASPYDIYFEPASEIQYYNAADCGEVETYTMSFYNPFGDEDALVWNDAEHEEAYYTDQPLNTSIDVFPTMVYNGWAFIGWTANQQYNELIGEENLDDENSATDDPASSFTIYSNTAGWAYTLNDNVTMYPVFTKYEDNEDIDLGSGGEYYMYFYQEGDYYKDDYFGADNHYQRMYALAGGGDNGEFGYTTNCNNAQIFEFIKEGDGWNIRVKNADGTYPTKSYLVNTSGNDYDLVAAKPSSKWSITKEPEGNYTMWYKGNATNQTTPGFYVAKAREYSGGSSWNFKCYNQDNYASEYYYKVYLGTCENRVFSSNPTNKPTITLSGEPIVTSTQDQSIRAQGELSISATKLAANGTITLTADNADVYFSSVKDANFTQATKPVTPLTLYADEKGKLAMTTVYVHYKPTSRSSLGVQIATITATTGTNGQPDYATATTTAALRNLPADFVIAAKWGDNWYAMPANMDSQSSTEGWLIEVDDAANPTKAIAAPNTTKYGLKSVYTSNSTDDRFENYGERLVFVENVTEITPVANKTLYNGGDGSSSKTNIQVYAQYKTATGGYYNTNPDRYEWIPTTTDMIDYTLTSGEILTGDAVGRTVSLDNHGIFGTLLQDKSYNGMVRLLPVDNFYEPIELQVVEWKQNSVSVMYTGAGTKYTTQVGNNAESSVLAAIDHAVYSLSTADLTTATNQPLIITIKDDADAIIGAVKLTIPAIVATNNTSTALGVTKENAKATSIVVLDDATLTADATKYTYDDITVYPGGKLVIGQSGQLGMYSLTLRAGSSWGAAEYEHKYPQFVLNNSATDAYSNSSAQINLDYVTTKEQYYTFVAPFDVNTKDIKYPVDIYGSNVDKANKGSFEFQYYNGEARAAGSPGWKVVEEGAEGATLKAGQGYTFLGMPKKIDGNRQKYGIHRIPMKVAASTAQLHETTDQTVPLSVHLSAKNNNSGWNLVGNPYMSNVANLSNNDIQVGELVHTNDANGNWTGGWHWDDPTTGQRFLVIPSNDGKSYEAVQASNATLPAFKNFFVQISNESANAMSIPVENRVERNLAPARYAEALPERDVEVAIVLEQDEAHSDQLDFLLNDTYSAAFDFNGDFTKMMNATNLNIYGVHTDDNLSFIAIDQHTAQQSIPIGYQVPAAGEYTLRISDKPYVMWNEIDALYVTDHEMSPEVTVDLLHAPYEFSVNQAETNNERFTVSVRVKAKTENGATGLGNVGADGEQIHKFIYQDKMYILHHGVIYDATGKRVITINK